MSVPEIIQQVCSSNDWSYQAGKAEVALGDGRKQVLFATTFSHDGGDMVRLHTVVGDAKVLTETRLRAALSLNSSVAFGALAVQGEDLVMTDTFLISDADQGEVSRSMRFLAETADKYERMIYGTDDH
ncbi:MAG: hypothetical protein AAF517_18190 [Planctomycetota bacterium]